MILFFSLMITYPASGQDERIKEVYTRNVISFYGENQFMRNNQVLRYKEVVPLLKSFPPSELEYSISHKKTTIADILLIPIAASIVLFVTESNRQNDIVYGYAIVGAGFLTTRRMFLDNGKKHLQKSVWLYNRDIMMKKF